MKGTNYYRLAITDKDGRTTYSETEIIKLNGYIATVTVYPNPVTAHQLTVNASALQPGIGKLAVHLFNDLGQDMLHQTMQAGISKVFSVAGFSKGNYRLQLTGSNGYSSIHPVVIR